MNGLKERDKNKLVGPNISCIYVWFKEREKEGRTMFMKKNSKLTDHPCTKNKREETQSYIVEPVANKRIRTLHSMRVCTKRK